MFVFIRVYFILKRICKKFESVPIFIFVVIYNEKGISFISKTSTELPTYFFLILRLSCALIRLKIVSKLSLKILCFFRKNVLYGSGIVCFFMTKLIPYSSSRYIILSRFLYSGGSFSLLFINTVYPSSINLFIVCLSGVSLYAVISL